MRRISLSTRPTAVSVRGTYILGGLPHVHPHSPGVGSHLSGGLEVYKPIGWATLFLWKSAPPKCPASVNVC